MNGHAESVESEVHAELQIRNRRADSVESELRATTMDTELRAAPKSRIVKTDVRTKTAFNTTV